MAFRHADAGYSALAAPCHTCVYSAMPPTCHITLDADSHAKMPMLRRVLLLIFTLIDTLLPLRRADA